MAKKTCALCGRQMGMLSIPREISDGYVCPTCLMQSGISSIDNLKSYTAENLKKICDEQKSLLDIFSETKQLTPNFLIDETNRLILIKAEFGTKQDIFRFENIFNYELFEDGESLTKGGVGSAVAGGLLFGGVGAIVGGATGGKKTKQIVTEMNVKITLKDSYATNVYAYICGKVKKSSINYTNYKKQAQLIVSELQLIIDQNKKTESLSSAQPVSAADEILKFKQLLDSGIITQEEFEAKKKQLLGL